MNPFRVHEFFKLDEILKAAKPARDELKRQLEQLLEARVKSAG